MGFALPARQIEKKIDIYFEKNFEKNASGRPGRPGLMTRPGPQRTRIEFWQSKNSEKSKSLSSTAV